MMVAFRNGSSATGASGMPSHLVLNLDSLDYKDSMVESQRNYAHLPVDAYVLPNVKIAPYLQINFLR
jgi:hypothetical protein